MSSRRSVRSKSKMVLRRNHQPETSGFIYFLMLTQTLPNHAGQLDQDFTAQLKPRGSSWMFQGKVGSGHLSSQSFCVLRIP